MKQNPKRSASARRFNTVLIVWLCLTFFFLLFPILGIAIMSFNSSKYGALPFDFTTKWYAELFRSADLISATWYSLWFSLLVSLCAAVLGIMASLALRRMSRKWNRAFPTLMNVPVIIPWLATAALQLPRYRQIVCQSILRVPRRGHAALVPHYVFAHYDDG